jgi:hypothetical protein
MMESPSSKRLVRPAEIEAEVQAANRRFVRYQSTVAATPINGVAAAQERAAVTDLTARHPG